VEIACNYLIPEDFDGEIWKKLNSLERFYLKGIEFEMHKEARTGAYQELAKGFGIREYKKLFAETTANMARLKTPIEFKKSMLSDSDFVNTLLRQILMTVFITFTDETPKSGLDYIKNEIKDYWGQRKLIQEILQFIMRTKHFDHLTHWRPCADSAELLNGLIENDRG
jgi:hypothetical protein